LIIADNLSDDPGVLATLRAAARDGSVVFRFAGYHNILHDSARFGPLHAALAAGARWRLVTDTDERLVWLEEGRWLADARLPERLPPAPGGRSGGGAAVPGLLLPGLPEDADRFALPDPGPRLAGVMIWGKPAVAGPVLPPGLRCHNIQHPAALFADAIAPRLVLLHLNRLLPARTLVVNHDKLVARGFCAPKSRPEEVAMRDPATVVDPAVRRTLREMRLVLHPPKAEGPPPVALRIVPDGTIEAGPEAAARLAMLLQDGPAMLAAARQAT
ncbi:MAG: hypothetical protein H5U20_07555, partial [Rhodobacteraceae bacterium]|nr:hypothetical protein [Paracoccaceae bacterium]